MKRTIMQAILLLALLASMTNVSAQTYFYSVVGIPNPAGSLNASVFIATRGADDVTATLQAYDKDGMAGEEQTLTIPGKGFVRLDREGLVLGIDAGARKLVVMADGELNVSAMRMIWGDNAVALPVQHWSTSAAPPGADVPNIPINLAAVAITEGLDAADGRIDVSWDAVDVSAVDWGVTYSIRYRAEGGEWTETDVGNVVEYTFTGIAGNTYDVRIRADRSDDVASSDWSESVSVQARNLAPGAVARGHISDERNVLLWGPGRSERATSFELQYREQGDVADSSWITADLVYDEGAVIFNYSSLRGTFEARLRGRRDFADPGPWTVFTFQRL